MATARLHSLTLDGFKSFAGRVELVFPAAITAIVGPNGVGKSNICDAIAWALGEQSARLLRSQTMADVIFAGSPSRDVAGSATVALTLASDDGRWADNEGRLLVGRRVSRDGTSDYRMAGRRVRLKDILEELADAGMGTRAYAIIEQGRIGQVLSVRATERRALFEEAAGVTKYRMRRHEAELKLAETRANLARVADVAAEVRRQLDAARRQARRAERHRQLRLSLGELRGRLFAFRRVTLDEAVAQRRAELVAARAQEAVAAANLGTAEAAHESLRSELDAARQALDEVRAEVSSVDAAAARLEAEEGAARREQEESADRSGKAEEEGRRLATEAEERTVQEAELAARADSAGASAEALEGEAVAASEAADGCDSAARTAAALAEEGRRALLTATASLTEARNKAHRLDVELDQNGYQRRRLSSELERLQMHLGEVREREDAAATAEADARRIAGAAEEQRSDLRTRHERTAAQASELTAQRDRAAHERWQARHDREGAERLLESARTLPQAVARAVADHALLGTVADFLDADRETARLLDRVYGDLLTLPVLAGEAPLAALSERRERDSGRLEVVLAEPGATPRPSPLLERCAIDTENLGWLTRALPRATTAETSQEAARVAADDPDLLVLLPDGAVRRGLRHELPGTAKRGAGVLQLRHRLGDAAGREAAAAAEEETRTAELAETQREAAELEPRLAEADDAVRRAAETLAAAMSTHDALHREMSRLQRELEAFTAEGDRLESERAQLEGALEAGRAEVERLAERAASAEREVDALARTSERAREEAAAARAEAERRGGAAAVAVERRDAAARELSRHRDALAELRQRQHAAVAEAEAQRQRSESASRRAVECRETLAELLARSTGLHREAETRNSREQQFRERAAASEKEVGRLRTLHLESRDAAHAVRLALAEAEGGVERLAETIALTLGPEVDLPDEAPEAGEIEELEADERRLQRDLEALGPVNELAVAERDELEERHRFLKGQRRDLERSLESLTETIRELDQICAERFLAALEEVNANFPHVFRELFGGGDAMVELSDPDNPLESGVEIRVRPPGKHTQSVLLLSGGEKALAAVALLLSLFRIRPAPFCVLDEVDAPLDDANVERFCRLLREMSDDTQFLLITHNRRTMAHADVLYGVTMEEPGVSRIVSVRMED